MLIKGGNAVDAAVATCFCLGVVYPMSSGIGGGAFMVVLDSASSKAQAFNSRETAPSAASKDMYGSNIKNKSECAISMGVPGEIARLYEAWSIYGKLDWADLFQPAIKLARDGFVVSHFLGLGINKTKSQEMVMRFLGAGETCYNRKLAETSEILANEGPSAFYNGELGKNFVKDVQEAGGIVTEEDLKNYKVDITDVVTTNHMLAYRMNLGDPKFVDITKYQAEMLSPSFAAEIRRNISDDTTHPSKYYLPEWSQLNDHGTSHFCVVDKDRNVVSVTATINHYFGAGLLSPSTGIILNNQMDDFSAPSEKPKGEDKLPPAPSNFIEPNKRPLSSMSPLIILKENQLVGVLGASGGINIIPAVTQVFLNHFIIRMTPLSAVKQPRVYHKVVPNVVLYENWTAVTGEDIQLSQDNISLLKGRNHVLNATAAGAICQLVVQNKLGKLTAVSDPRKGGRPAAVKFESSHPYIM
ncbi:hypothetical protein MKW98_016630 [Papaver atlanticum]|uniref:Uncharacterized protein n=1 Tax=Papaver atlanticum TaxID=357466 RepID=A0AAD4XJY0_9MAGN|nr:hypothetical protein MKW98_016630 [Papaver atlanticum]